MVNGFFGGKEILESYAFHVFELFDELGKGDDSLRELTNLKPYGIVSYGAYDYVELVKLVPCPVLSVL